MRYIPLKFGTLEPEDQICILEREIVKRNISLIEKKNYKKFKIQMHSKKSIIAIYLDFKSVEVKRSKNKRLQVIICRVGISL